MANKLARYLRRNATLAERILWARLRLLKPQGFHFRRQAPIGGYIVDFVCIRKKLIVEIDGSQHGEPAAKFRDGRRTAFLSARGYRVLGYWNADVMRNSIEVAEATATAAAARRAEQGTGTFAPPGSRDEQPTDKLAGSPASPQGECCTLQTHIPPMGQALK